MATRKARPSPLDHAIRAFLERERYRPDGQRGYRCTDTEFILDRHTIAYWHEGAVIMNLEFDKWWPRMVANAIRRVRRAAKDAKVYGRKRGALRCREHEDCRRSKPLGMACAKQRFPKKVAPRITSQPRKPAWRQALGEV